MDEHLQPGRYVDSDHPAVIDFAEQTVTGLTTPKDQAVALYLAVRDDIRYDPYRLPTTHQGFSASATLQQGYGYCVPKAILLAASARAIGLPARIGFADVRNHLTSKRLRQSMGTDVFYWHGYTEIRLGGRWIKSTPAFNRRLCDIAGVEPLAWDGETDSLFQAHNPNGQQHMEYLNDRGNYDDLPLPAMLADLKTLYPNMPWQLDGDVPSITQSPQPVRDFEKEVETA